MINSTCLLMLRFVCRKCLLFQNLTFFTFLSIMDSAHSNPSVHPYLFTIPVATGKQQVKSNNTLSLDIILQHFPKYFFGRYDPWPLSFEKQSSSLSLQEKLSYFLTRMFASLKCLFHM